ncbi:MAG: hypothetical protein K0Q49_2469 [Haloplasmataceae bacterium]|nr:hypothetical protein [Haloplasmataceae bacterium]
MSALDTFRKRMLTTSGSSIRDEQIKNGKKILESTFLDDASANPNIVFWDTETKIDCRITGRKSTGGRDTAKIQTFITNTITVGDIIYDTVEHEYWVCTSLFKLGEIHKQGEITLCNYTIKFQHPTTGTILSYPCITSSTRLGQEENKYMTLGNNEKSIYYFIRN